MSNPTRTEAIKSFLLKSTVDDLAEAYNYEMECQVNVAQDGGTRIEGEYLGHRWLGWSDGLTTWKSFRIPHNASSEPSYTDTPMNFDLPAHAEGIGMTGWNWVRRESMWVGFDFDAITGHSEKHARKCSEKELLTIRETLDDLEWVTIRHSTSGKGLHLYVHLPNIPTNTHTEHQALARSILGLLSGLTGFDFAAKVDVCGGNMWVWHRKMKGTRGLTLIKKGQLLTEIPPNWKDHIHVVSGRRRKNLPQWIENSDEAVDVFENFIGQRPRTPLDADHLLLIDWLRANHSDGWWWDNDHHMLVTHTLHLAEAHKELKYKGIFKTSSTGSSPQNCFLFPMKRGAWSVRRYTQGVAEDSSWTQDGEGYTRCYFNRSPDLATLSRARGANELVNGSFAFGDAATAAEAARELGADCNIPDSLAGRKAKLKTHKDGRLIVELALEAKDSVTLPSESLQGWEAEGKSWKRIFNVYSTGPAESEIGDYDELVRHLITASNEDCGWVIQEDGVWTVEPVYHVRLALGSMGLKNNEIANVLGSQIFKRWTLVKRPFDLEYPGDRMWNRSSPQFAIVPSLGKDDYYHPTWSKILKHCGTRLDYAITQHPWMQAHGVLTGGEYLKLWMASLVQYPTEPLPYLFFYSEEQNTGKSTIHEALSLLMTRGRVRADHALASVSGFNAELEDAVLCVVEEIDISKNQAAYNRIKDWVNAPYLPIHRKGCTPYTVINTTHWIQCSNSARACPISFGDTRVTMAYVPPLEPGSLVPKRELFEALTKEASDFLGALLSLEIPLSNDRLMLPIIETDEKIMTQRSNRSMLERFLEENFYYVPGATYLYSQFVTEFQEWLDPGDRFEWTRRRVGHELPSQYPHARSVEQQSHYMIGNLSRREEPPQGPPFVVRLRGKSEYLVPQFGV